MTGHDDEGIEVRVQLMKFMIGDECLSYVFQVPQSSEVSDWLTKEGWDPNSPAAAEDWDLKNTVLFSTSDDEVRLRLFTEEQWTEAEEVGMTFIGIETIEGES
jgi:hypothetical protein